jgi:hypothetical protein
MRRRLRLTLVPLTLTGGLTAAALGIGGPHAAPGQLTLHRDVLAGRGLTTDQMAPEQLAPSDHSNRPQPGTAIEPTIAVNPAHPNVVVAAYQSGHVPSGGAAALASVTSYDGGRTWTAPTFAPFTVAADPRQPWLNSADTVLAYSPDGGSLYLGGSSIDFVDPTHGLPSKIRVAVSHDDGRTWSTPYVVAEQQSAPSVYDKPAITVDGTRAPGHHYGRVYVTFMDLFVGALVRYSDDDGHTWSDGTPSPLCGAGTPGPYATLGAANAGPVPVVLPDGSLAVVSVGANTLVNGPTIEEPGLGQQELGYALLLSRAPAAGSTGGRCPLQFDPPTLITSIRAASLPDERQGFPFGATLDSSGALVVAWADGADRNDDANSIKLTRSSDYVSWSPAVTVPSVDAVSSEYQPQLLGTAEGVVLATHERHPDDPHTRTVVRLLDGISEASVATAPTTVVGVADNDVRWAALAVRPILPTYELFLGDYFGLATAGDRLWVARAEAIPLGATPPAASTPDHTDFDEPRSSSIYVATLCLRGDCGSG